jgi:succinyl-diaminopimelate desuccinylase
VIPESDPYVTACLNVYKEFTGKVEVKSCINAGGTYARLLPCAVEIGTSLNGDKTSFSLPNGHGQVHQPDEYISIDGLLNAIEITLLMLLECDKTKEDI